MAKNKATVTSLSRLTRKIDPRGRGVSMQLIAFLASDQPWARETTRPATAQLIEDALEAPRGSLFVLEDIFARTDPQPAWESL